MATFYDTLATDSTKDPAADGGLKISGDELTLRARREVA
jgi:hypothetical protein